MLKKAFCSFFITLLFCHFGSLAQDKSETQEWLKNKLEFWSLSPKCGGMDIGITFVGCEMYIKGVNTHGDRITTIIPISDLGDINFEKKTIESITYTNMVIHTKDYARTILHRASDGLTYEFVSVNLQVSQGLDYESKRRIRFAFDHLGALCNQSNNLF